MGSNGKAWNDNIVLGPLSLAGLGQPAASEAAAPATAAAAAAASAAAAAAAGAAAAAAAASAAAAPATAAAAAAAAASAAAAAADASHGSWIVSCTSHQRRQCLDSAYILSYAGDAKHHPRTRAQICFQTFRASLKRAVKHKKLETLFAQKDGNTTF